MFRKRTAASSSNMASFLEWGNIEAGGKERGNQVEALDIWVKGIVQGVGFRPFVYRLAKRNLITGWVLNGTDGVHIHAEGESQNLDAFVMELSENAPAAAQITEIEMHEVPLEPFADFEIRFSDDQTENAPTLVSPDLAMCSDCEQELFDPADRRYRYPFINCTNCGPRFTITSRLPYDRANTSMRAFPMCPACRAEYADPEDRRFHAQPDACFECGPHLTWRYSKNTQPDQSKTPSFPKPEENGWAVARTREQSDALLSAAVRLIAEGGILAIKGLGGYHLACDATNETAVARLRERKGRDGKAFAVMMRNVNDVREVCHVSAEEDAILSGSQRPIILLRKRAKRELAKGVADRLPELGVMLPYTPVQHLLLHDLADARAVEKSSTQIVETGENPSALSGSHPSFPVLVMTSGNVHDEPIVTSDEEAWEKLRSIADAFLGNDREILTRFDDSVVRVLDLGTAVDGARETAVQFIRRARGYAPAPIVMSEGVRPDSSDDPSDRKAQQSDAVFATGPEQKNTFAFLRGREAFVSQHVGDMENAETFDAWLQAKARFQKLFDLVPARLACDLHPEYLTTKWAMEQAAIEGLPLTRVQHHHAHIVSAMAESGLRGPVCGIAFDGTGYGTDGNIWGGEVLLSNLKAFERFANFAYVPMPGGAAAIRNPLRMALGVLWEFDLLEHLGARRALEELGPEQVELCERMIEQGLNTPVTSSCGRLFDAASALLGICTRPTYEGEAAILLEAAITPTETEGETGEMLNPSTAKATGEANADGGPATSAMEDPRYAISVIKNTAAENDTAETASVLLLDAAPVFQALLDDLAAGVPVGVIARRFHEAMVGAVVTIAQLTEALYGIRDIVLTGGVFMNRFLVERCVQRLTKLGCTVILNRELPPNDGCVSLGQAIVAAAQISD